jgi:hypothetical protein
MRYIMHGWDSGHEWSAGTEWCRTLNSSGAIGSLTLLTSLRYGICRERRVMENLCEKQYFTLCRRTFILLDAILHEQ